MFGSSFVIGIGHRQRESVVDELGSAAKAVPHGWVTLSGTLKPRKGLFTSSFWIYNSKKTKRQKKPFLRIWPVAVSWNFQSHSERQWQSRMLRYFHFSLSHSPLPSRQFMLLTHGMLLLFAWGPFGMRWPNTVDRSYTTMLFNFFIWQIVQCCCQMTSLPWKQQKTQILEAQNPL